MNFKAAIDIMPLKELLDPQGKAVASNMKNLQITDIDEVRIGKHIELTLTAHDEAAAREKVETACQKLLANPVIEYYEFEVSAVKEEA